MSNTSNPKITFRYEDKIENLLDQYSQQLAVEDQRFALRNKNLDRHDYACARDSDPILGCILEVIAKIYETSIPIVIIIEDDRVKPSPDIGRGNTH